MSAANQVWIAKARRYSPDWDGNSTEILGHFTNFRAASEAITKSIRDCEDGQEYLPQLLAEWKKTVSKFNTIDDCDAELDNYEAGADTYVWTVERIVVKATFDK